MEELNVRNVSLTFIILYLTPIIAIDLAIVDEIDYVNFLLKNIPENEIDEAIKSINKSRWYSYGLTIIFVSIKSFFVAAIIWTGAFLSKHRLTIINIWKITFISQMVFSLKGWWLLITGLFDKNFDLEYLQSFNPLSLSSIFNSEVSNKYFAFILQSLNLFELAYWIVMAYLLSKLLKTGLNEGLKLILSSYVPAFGLWLLAVTFFLVSNG